MKKNFALYVNKNIIIKGLMISLILLMLIVTLGCESSDSVIEKEQSYDDVSILRSSWFESSQYVDSNLQNESPIPNSSKYSIGGPHHFYSLLNDFIPVNLLEDMSIETLFISGQSLESFNLTNYGDYARYNPSFIEWVLSMTQSVLSHSTLISLTQNYYNSYYKTYLREYVDAYKMLQNHSDLSSLVSEYTSLVEGNRSHRFVPPYTIESTIASSSHSITSKTATLFWIRRHTDSSHEGLYSILSTLVNTFDPTYIH
ncbi:hypothetical protein DID78_02675 [Candidatus Marinamargulisbacteria bacterium SCGC AG-343-D04]|nr:hypothetical protein DID78_02675 [Candidatus Marinamargulisbacteria bacterium SCGC AG-343-D04]